ncbi:MAG: tetratricopeptide repeat protein [Rhodoferax sp.]|nr:tetratricopeptide repeat protein [Rhodoferax sp.]
MANQLDLEEQEQLDQLKHFWKQYGNLISWLLIAVLASFAAWNGYHYWQRSQAAQAAGMFDELERITAQGDVALLERAFSDMKDKYPRTTFAQQGGLLAAKALHEGGKPDAAQAALTWVADNATDDAYRAIAKLRLAAVLAEKKSYDLALAQLAGSFPPEFLGLVADRRGDVFSLQGKAADARAEYSRAYQAMDDRVEYRRLVEIKLNALGADTRALAAGDATPGGAASVAGASK